MWYALTGHEPDDAKVPASEFMLLSIIASRKSDGIAQTDLVRLSGQDKRSVPKRTDALAQKGYVEKRPIQIRSARTSLVIFRRFVKPATVEATVEGTSAGASERPIINFDAFTAKLFEILKEFGIISRNDLKRRLGFDDRWRWRVLSRALRKYERIGVLKRVRAKSQYDKIHPCVMLIREPTETDIAKFNAVSGDLNQTADDQADVDDDIDDAAGDETVGVDEGALEVSKDKPVIEAGRAVPSWTPDRPLGNQVFDVVNNSGTAGITNNVIFTVDLLKVRCIVLPIAGNCHSHPTCGTLPLSGTQPSRGLRSSMYTIRPIILRRWWRVVKHHGRQWSFQHKKPRRRSA
jgi:transcription factor C subunit 3